MHSNVHIFNRLLLSGSLGLEVFLKCKDVSWNLEFHNGSDWTCDRTAAVFWAGSMMVVTHINLGEKTQGNVPPLPTPSYATTRPFIVQALSLVSFFSDLFLSPSSVIALRFSVSIVSSLGQGPILPSQASHT